MRAPTSDPAGAGTSAATSARSIESRSEKCVKTCSTGAAIAFQFAATGGCAGCACALRANPCPAPRSCRREVRAAGGGGAGSRRRRGGRRRRCRSASAAASSRPSPEARAGGPRAARGRAPTRGRGCRPASSACRSWRRDPSAPRRTRRRGRSGRAAAASSRISGFAAGSGVSMAKRRAMTRSTLPSTTATGSSKAIAAIAAEV